MIDEIVTLDDPGASDEEEQAQFEIREYAKAAESFLERLMPVTHAAFVAGGRVAP